MRVKATFLFFVLCLCHAVAFAQGTLLNDLHSFGGLTAAYSQSGNHLTNGRRAYTLQPSENGVPGIMQADFGIRYQSRGFTATVVGQQGWFADANYTGRDYAYRYLQQAFASIDLMQNVELRAGIMPSHIGYESMNERDNYVVSRLFCSDATPYYETGASLQWHAGDKLTVEGLVLNGWQRIIATNTNLAYGMRVVWQPDSTLTVNWSSFYGNMFDRTNTQLTTSQQLGWRLYNNFWTEWAATSALTVIAIADHGVQAIGNDSTATTWCLAVIATYRLRPEWRVSVRAENFSDPASVIFHPSTPRGFEAASVSSNVDWTISPKTTIRAELRRMTSSSNLFPTSAGYAPSETFGTVTIDYQL